MPTPEAKADAWTTAVESTSVTNAIQSSVIGGFSRVHDLGLLVPFVEPYFQSLEDVWVSRTNETAQSIVTGLYPVALTGTEVDVLARTDAWLEQLGDRHPALRRLVVEARDGSRRALAAQERDRG